MADTVCVLCGEPWSTYHLNFDAPFYVRKLFRAGKGCECCEGVPSKEEPTEEQLRVLLDGGDDEDVMPQIMSLEGGRKDYSAEWEAARAEVEVFAQCEGCGKKVQFDAEDIYGKYVEGKGWVKALHVRKSNVNHLERSFETVLVALSDIKEGKATAFGEPVDMPNVDGVSIEVVIIGGKEYDLCEDCHTSCDECGADLFDGAAHDALVIDSYDPGASLFEYPNTYCVECLPSEDSDEEE